MKEGIHRPGPSGGEHRPRSNAVHHTQHIEEAQDDEEMVSHCGISGLANWRNGRRRNRLGDCGSKEARRSGGLCFEDGEDRERCSMPQSQQEKQRIWTVAGAERHGKSNGLSW